jgi:hypothetical protein
MTGYPGWKCPKVNILDGPKINLGGQLQSTNPYTGGLDPIKILHLVVPQSREPTNGQHIQCHIRREISRGRLGKECLTTDVPNEGLYGSCRTPRPAVSGTSLEVSAPVQFTTSPHYLWYKTLLETEYKGGKGRLVNVNPAPLDSKGISTANQSKASTHQTSDCTSNSAGNCSSICSLTRQGCITHHSVLSSSVMCQDPCSQCHKC